MKFDLATLKHIKFIFDLYSDHSTSTLGYKRLCEIIEEEEAKEPKEYVLCAANHFDDGKEHVHVPKNITSGFVVCGQRHHNCFYTVSILLEKNEKEFHKLEDKCIQGFLTNTNRFVDRKEGARIAYDAGQISTLGEDQSLYSEDLY